jgi:hypothetical protein
VMKNGRIETEVDADHTSLEYLFSLCMQ